MPSATLSAACSPAEPSAGKTSDQSDAATITPPEKPLRYGKHFPKLFSGIKHASKAPITVIAKIKDKPKITAKAFPIFSPLLKQAA